MATPAGRCATVTGLVGGGVSLLAFALSSLQGEAKHRTAKRRKKTNQDSREDARKRVNRCLTADLPYFSRTVMGCPDRETATEADQSCGDQCWIPVADCCYRAKFSEAARCSCIDSLAWFVCP